MQGYHEVAPSFSSLALDLFDVFLQLTWPIPTLESSTPHTVLRTSSFALLLLARYTQKARIYKLRRVDLFAV